MPTLKIHKKSRFQPNEEIFAESCLVRYKDLFWAKKFFGFIGTLIPPGKLLSNMDSKQLDCPVTALQMTSKPNFPGIHGEMMLFASRSLSQ